MDGDGGFFMTTQEKRAFYRTVRQEIQTTGGKINDVCKNYGLSPRAYSQWARRERIKEEKEQVITLKPDGRPFGYPKTVAVVIGSARFEFQYSDQSDLMEIVRIFRNV